MHHQQPLRARWYPILHAAPCATQQPYWKRRAGSFFFPTSRSPDLILMTQCCLQMCLWRRNAKRLLGVPGLCSVFVIVDVGSMPDALSGRMYAAIASVVQLLTWRSSLLNLPQLFSRNPTGWWRIWLIQWQSGSISWTPGRPHEYSVDTLAPSSNRRVW